MNNYIKSVDDLFEFLNENSKSEKAKIFRGEKSSKYELRPSIGRYKMPKSQNDFKVENERKILKVFRQKSLPFLEKEYKDLDLLALAQHHGLPTRLLDWTWNPLVAIFFAVNEDLKDEPGTESKIYAWTKDITAKLNPPHINPFEIKEITLFLPNHLTKRIIAQNGIFTIHPDPYQDCRLKLNGLEEFIIAHNCRKQIKKAIQTMGVHYASMFPDLEGIGKYVKWLRTNSY